MFFLNLLKYFNDILHNMHINIIICHMLPFFLFIFIWRIAMYIIIYLFDVFAYLTYSQVKSLYVKNNIVLLHPSLYLCKFYHFCTFHIFIHFPLLEIAAYTY